MRPRRWFGASAVIALALTLIVIRSLDAPLVLYPSSASLPAGLYIRTFEPIRPGTIVAFPVPDNARRYQKQLGIEVLPTHLLLKPVAAAPGDRVCSNPVAGLKINGDWMAPVARVDNNGMPLPIWHLCRRLVVGEFFMFSDTVSNSFDSRYYGPVPNTKILGTYRHVIGSRSRSYPTRLE